MFKKIEIWVLYLVLLLALVFSIFFGALVRQELVGETKFGFLSQKALFLAEIPHNIYKIITLNDDLILENRFPEKTGFVGKPTEAETYLLQTRYDGDIAESVVELVDLRSFEILHTWNPDITAFNNMADRNNPELAFLDDHRNETRGMIAHPLLLDDGSIVFQDISPLKRIGYCSDIRWLNDEDIYHHSIEADHEGNIWVGARLHPPRVDVKYVGENAFDFFDDGLVKVSPDGEILYQKSLHELFIENGMKYLLFAVYAPHFYGDVIHMNDIQPVFEDGPYWKQGDLFVSMRHQSMVLLYRPSTNEIVWKSTGHFLSQHDVDILDNHRISIFDNNSLNSVDGIIVDGHNQMVIYDFETDTYTTYLTEALAEQDVRTPTGGRGQILDNGDLYIEETDFGRTLYFNKDGSLLWEHVNRDSKGNVYPVNWSRILYKPEDLAKVRTLIEEKECP